MSDTDRRKTIVNTVKDLVADLLWYGRKEDDELPRGSIEEAIEHGEITAKDIVGVFESELKEALDLE